jgi:phosphoglycolate phosphatase
MEKERIVIFDMDGTLVDSATDITVTVNYIRRTRGLDPILTDTVVREINSGNTKLAEFFYGTPTYEKKERELFETHYWEQCVQNIRVYSGIVETLELLRSRDIRLSVATNAATIFAKKMLKTTGLHTHFDFIMGSCDVKNSKPNPEIVHKIMSRYRFDLTTHSLPVLVGDSHKDMGAAKEARIHAIHARWGFESDDFAGVVSALSPSEIPTLLERLK